VVDDDLQGGKLCGQPGHDAELARGRLDSGHQAVAVEQGQVVADTLVIENIPAGGMPGQSRHQPHPDTADQRPLPAVLDQVGEGC
jgi:hypothetical protein